MPDTFITEYPRSIIQLPMADVTVYLLPIASFNTTKQ